MVLGYSKRRSSVGEQEPDSGCTYFDGYNRCYDTRQYEPEEQDEIGISAISTSISNALAMASRNKNDCDVYNVVSMLLQKYSRVSTLLNIYGNIHKDIVAAACHTYNIKHDVLKKEASKYTEINTKMLSIIQVFRYYDCDYRQLLGEGTLWQAGQWIDVDDFIDDMHSMADSLCKMTNMFNNIVGYYSTCTNIKNSHA